MQLPEQEIMQLFPGPFRAWTWTPPTVADFAGPKDLASLLTSYRQRLREIHREGGQPVGGSLGDLSDPALEPLLKIAYQASFLTEEGRPVRACLYVPPQ